MPTLPKGFDFSPFKGNVPLVSQLTATRLNGMLDAIRRCYVEFGDNITGTRTAGGVIVRGTPGGGGDGGGDPDITFFLSDATETVDNVVSNKVFIADGKIDGEYPVGMGTGEYTLDVDDPADSLIYAAATFDPETLELTSRFLGASGSGDFPESRVDEDGGFLYWLLGYTFFDGDDAFRIVMVRTGDIYTELMYGADNAQPALWGGPGIGWLDLEDLPE